jgi:methionine synthase reductase
MDTTFDSLISFFVGQAEFQRIREQRPTVLEILNAFPTCLIPIERLIELLPALQPRLYSAINTSVTEPKVVRCVFNVAEYYLPKPWNILRHGTCTTWIDDLVERPLTKDLRRDVRERDIRIAMYKRPSSAFTVPEDHLQPMILVGPGTGVAPFIGFLEHRRYMRKQYRVELGETWLFFGCRFAEKDFLYENALKSYVNDGTLRRLVVCFSRVPELSEGRRYVQDGLRQFSEDILRLMLEENANMYICGNLSSMIRDIDEVMVHLLHNNRHLSLEESRTLLQKWIAEKKLIRDLWS